MKQNLNNPNRPRRGAMLSIELVMALPILLIVLLGAVEFTFLLLSTQAITAASSVGARQGALPGVVAEDIDEAIHEALGSWRFATDDALEVKIYLDTNDDDEFELVYRSGPGSDLPDDDNQLGQAATGTPVMVTLTLPATAASPDLLKIIPFMTIENQELTASFVTRKE